MLYNHRAHIMDDNPRTPVLAIGINRAVLIISKPESNIRTAITGKLISRGSSWVEWCADYLAAWSDIDQYLRQCLIVCIVEPHTLSDDVGVNQEIIHSVKARSIICQNIDRRCCVWAIHCSIESENISHRIRLAEVDVHVRVIESHPHLLR